jgi:hypothetical protein
MGRKTDDRAIVADRRPPIEQNLQRTPHGNDAARKARLG